jgi:protein phosphatase
VHDFLRDDKIAETMRTSTEGLDDAARRIVQAALANVGADNLTCQIARVDNPGKLDEAAHIEKLSAPPLPPELTAGQAFEGYRTLQELHLSKRTQVYFAKDEASGDSAVLEDAFNQ